MVKLPSLWLITKVCTNTLLHLIDVSEYDNMNAHIDIMLMCYL